jgi:hypothetical protein
VNEVIDDARGNPKEATPQAIETMGFLFDYLLGAASQIEWVCTLKHESMLGSHRFTSFKSWWVFGTSVGS